MSRAEPPPRVGAPTAVRRVGWDLPRPRPHIDRFDAAVVAAILVLATYLLVDYLLADEAGHLVSPALDLILDTVSVVVMFVAATLAWVRYRWRGEPIALYEASAFMVITIAAISAVVLTMVAGGHPDVDLTVPAQRQQEVFAGARFIAGAVLIIGGWRALAGLRAGPVPAVLLVPSGLTIAVVAAAVVVGDSLPLSNPLATGGPSLDLQGRPRASRPRSPEPSSPAPRRSSVGTLPAATGPSETGTWPSAWPWHRSHRSTRRSIRTLTPSTSAQATSCGSASGDADPLIERCGPRLGP